MCFGDMASLLRIWRRVFNSDDRFAHVISYLTGDFIRVSDFLHGYGSITLGVDSDVAKVYDAPDD